MPGRRGRAMPGRRGRAMPGRFAETVGLDDSFEKKNSWEESLARQCRAGGAAGRLLCQAGGAAGM